MPALFALCANVFDRPAMATFASFGAFAMLLLVDFAGPTAQRLRAYSALIVAWLVLVTLGSLAAGSVPLAVAATFVVGFTVIFAGVVSSVLAGATTSLLLAFILPVATPAPVAQLADRLAGVALAGVATLVAVSVLWPRTSTDLLSVPAARVCRAAATQLRTDADAFERRTGGVGVQECRTCAMETAASAQALRTVFTGMPYRPTGLSTGSRALVRLVDELTWLTEILVDSGPQAEDGPPGDRESTVVRQAAAAVLDQCADLLEDPARDTDLLRAATQRLRTLLSALEDGAVGRLPVSEAVGADLDLDAFLGSLAVSFRAQETAFVALQIAQNVETARAADHRRWLDRLLGREPGTATGPLASAMERAVAHAEPHSVWLHNSIRGAVGLAVAVALANATGVQHAFWVILGTLAVLRSNALSTGQNVFRALGGTVVGSVLGAGLVELIGKDLPVLWVLLPIAILFAGIAPAVISFAAGQMAFTVTLVILYSIAQPSGWTIALFRLEDIALGCSVSLVVGLLFWPRGAAAAVDKALADAYVDSATYLAGAVDYAVSCCVFGPAEIEVPQEGRRAAAAARRLDDAFRTYLAERGPKSVPLGEMTTLVTGVVGLRLAADAVLELWRRSSPDGRSIADRAAARQELMVMAGRIQRWYEGLAAGLEGGARVPKPSGSDRTADSRLAEAVRRDLREDDGRVTATGIRIIWTGDHLDAVRRLQPALAAAAGDPRVGATLA